MHKQRKYQIKLTVLPGAPRLGVTASAPTPLGILEGRKALIANPPSEAFSCNAPALDTLTIVVVESDVVYDGIFVGFATNYRKIHARASNWLCKPLSWEIKRIQLFKDIFPAKYICNYSNGTWV